MGVFSKKERAYDFQESKPFQRAIKKRIVRQIAILLKTFLKREISDSEAHKFGIEMEAHAIKKATPNSPFIVQTDLSREYTREAEDFDIQPEGSSWVLELVPKRPFSKFLGKAEIEIFISSVYRFYKHPGHPNLLFLSFMPKAGSKYLSKDLKIKNYETPEIFSQQNKITKSLYLSDKSICNAFPRYIATAKFPEQRSQIKISRQIPLYQDSYTNKKSPIEGEKKAGNSYQDATSFSLTYCSMQVTFSAKNLTEARWLYDQFHMFTPIFLALTASTPIFKDKLVATSTRWNILAAGYDCRTQSERDNGVPTRWGTVNHFISKDPRNLQSLNDKPYFLNLKARKQLKQLCKEQNLEIDKRLLDHFSYLLQRDLNNVFDSMVDEVASDPNIQDIQIFEYIQGTNWFDVRLKPPPFLDSEMGWRVEFRTCEIQPSQKSNAMVALAISTLARMLKCNELNLNFYLPISKGEINFERADLPYAATKQRFFWRTNIQENGEPKVTELTIQEIFSGSQKHGYPGLKNILEQFLSLQKTKEESTEEERNEAREAIQWMADIASGVRLTTSAFIRQFIDKHPLYKKDSVVPEDILNELIEELYAMQD